MANRFSVGESSFDDGSSTSPFGKIQHVAKQIDAQQVASLCYEFDTTYPGARARGDRLTINEAIREDDRAIQLYTDYVRDPAGHPLAAYASKGPPPVITTTHRASIGNALDMGITMANGKNRALTPDEAKWVDDNGPRRGIHGTGNYFARPESWHKNAGFAWSVPPIPGVNIPGEPLVGTSPLPKSLRGKSMYVVPGKSYWILIFGAKSWKIGSLTYKGKRWDGNDLRDLFRRVIRSNQSSDQPEEFLDIEIDVMLYIMQKKAK